MFVGINVCIFESKLCLQRLIMFVGFAFLRQNYGCRDELHEFMVSLVLVNFLGTRIMFAGSYFYETAAKSAE